jgi:hypothetical protein
MATLKTGKSPATGEIRRVTPDADAILDADDGSDPHGPEVVARRAFELFQARGEVHGHDIDDWLEAERLIREETASQPGWPDAPQMDR